MHKKVLEILIVIPSSNIDNNKPVSTKMVIASHNKFENKLLDMLYLIELSYLKYKKKRMSSI